jgi:hypothetical protein
MYIIQNAPMGGRANPNTATKTVTAGLFGKEKLIIAQNTRIIDRKTLSTILIGTCKHGWWTACH